MNKIFFITFVAISVLLSFNATAQEKKDKDILIEKHSKQGGMLLLRLKLVLHLRKLHNLFLYAMSCDRKNLR